MCFVADEGPLWIWWGDPPWYYGSEGSRTFCTDPWGLVSGPGHSRVPHGWSGLVQSEGRGPFFENSGVSLLLSLPPILATPTG